MLKKKEFTAEVAKASNNTGKVVDEVISAIISVVTEELKKGEKVSIHGLATFKPIEVKGGEKTFRNPITKETFTKVVEDSVKVNAKVDKALVSLLKK